MLDVVAGRHHVEVVPQAQDAEHALSYDLRGGTASAVTARILHADTPQAHNTREAPDAVAPADYDGFRLSEHTLTVTIPAHSFVTVRFT